MIKSTKVLILGAEGMLGQILYRYLARLGWLQVVGTVRGAFTHRTLLGQRTASLETEITIENHQRLERLIHNIRPTLVVNCIAVNTTTVSAHLNNANAVFPHILYSIVSKIDARLVHISTDGVFSGAKGTYTELDIPDSQDLYGRSKALGEIANERCLTLRTSVIGHDHCSGRGLLEWLLKQRGTINGYRNYIFSGITTVEFSRVIAEYILPHSELCGIMHLSTWPISKYDLLREIDLAYNLGLSIKPCDEPIIDRSLDSSLFRSLTGYIPPAWPSLISQMRDFN